ncbi:hypothetical protein HanPSC8_Chr16g0737241 [Helianthus annuus]|nr:hypothetical protein HanPSC8_Chr16g0737241 [Helianthus annuus]
MVTRKSQKWILRVSVRKEFNYKWSLRLRARSGPLQVRRGGVVVVVVLVQVLRSEKMNGKTLVLCTRFEYKLCFPCSLVLVGCKQMTSVKFWRLKVDMMISCA